MNVDLFIPGAGAVVPSTSSPAVLQTVLAANSEAVAAAYAATIQYVSGQESVPTQIQQIARQIAGPICFDWSTQEAVAVSDHIPCAIVEQPFVDVLAVREERPFLDRELLSITKSLMEILNEFETKKFIYADIKPEHLYLQPDTDGMFYTLAGLKPFEKYPTVGTTAYKPPFTFTADCNKYKNKIDTWSAGMTLLLMFLSDRKLEEIGAIFSEYNAADEAQKCAITVSKIHPWIEACRTGAIKDNFSTSHMCHLLYRLLDPNPSKSYSATQAVRLSRKLQEKDFFTVL